ncbi:peptidoglycan-binding domain-containing protein [Paraburkholderia sp. NPDC080076]|uniref:peptidoglycan-binding domain-containing protein n=1 Tax=Paraburkholderia sp. NPDC080076 TaxID=3390605 RepID=UPI003D0677B5
MRWGVCDFGQSASGDVQHFDLRPRIPSGVVGSEPPEVRIQLGTVSGVQQGLGALGFDAGDVTGVAGPSTTAAITAFRAARGLPPGGIDVILRATLDLALRQAAVPF